MKHIILFVYVAISVYGFSCKEISAQNQVTVVTPNEAKTILKDKKVQLIDVRTSNEFIEGHIKNAKNIDFLETTFLTNITALDKQKPVLVYCHSGKRSSKSAEALLKAGFTKIYNLEGGILNWKAKELPIVID